MSMKLGDFDLPDQEEYTSVPISKIGGQEITVTGVTEKLLGSNNGVVLALAKPVTAEGKEWNEVHTSINRVVSKMKLPDIQKALADGKTITMKVISGRNANGTWFDVE